MKAEFLKALERSISTEEVAGDEQAFPLREPLLVLWRRLWWIVLTITVLVGVATGFTLIQTPTYEASVTILVGEERGTINGPHQDASNLQQLTRTMTEAVSSRFIANAVIDRKSTRLNSSHNR
jgi:uncharacterized protein involved in exopolysaccharide biosynthesis